MIDIGINLHQIQFTHINKLALLKTSYQEGVEAIVLTSVNFDTLLKNLKLIEDMHEHTDIPKLYTTFGHHPHRAKDFVKDLQNLQHELNHQSNHHLDSMEYMFHQLNDSYGKKLSYQPIVFLGEIGLDYDRNISSPQVQKDVFDLYLQLNQRLKYPMFLHERNAFLDFNDFLEKRNIDMPSTRSIVHCFTGTELELAHYVEKGYTIGLTGFITNKKRAENIQSSLKNIPFSQLLLETDAPYMKPRNFQVKTQNIISLFEQKPEGNDFFHQINLPFYITHVYDYICSLHEIEKDFLIKKLNHNFNQMIEKKKNIKLDF